MTIAAESGLWTPPEFSDLFLVTVPDDADDATFEGMLLVNQAAKDWLNGRIDTGTYYDMVDSVGIDPIGFVNEVEEHLDLLIRDG